MIQNLHSKIVPSVDHKKNYSGHNYGLDYIFFRNKTLLFFKIES